MPYGFPRSSPPKQETPNPQDMGGQSCENCGSSSSPQLPPDNLKIDEDKALILLLLVILSKSGADMPLLLALLYVLM